MWCREIHSLSAGDTVSGSGPVQEQQHGCLGSWQPQGAPRALEEFSRGLPLFSAPWRGKGGAVGVSHSSFSCPLSQGAAISPNPAAGSAKLEPSGAFLTLLE